MNIKNVQNRQNERVKEHDEKTHSNLPDLVKRELFGVGITNERKENILKYIINSVQKSAKPYYIVTPNPEMIVFASKNNWFKNILNNAKIALPDGVGVVAGGSFLGKPFTERFTGVELVKMLCERLNDQPITVGFLGGGPNVAEMAAECLKCRYPNLKVGFVGQEWFEDALAQIEKKNEERKMKKDTASKANHSSSVFFHSSVDILFVAFGAPKQEVWMAEHLGTIPVKVMVGVGGAFDYISGKVPRAPKVLRVLGLEWLFRLIIQPWRWRRQLALIEFVGMVLKEKLKKQ